MLSWVYGHPKSSDRRNIKVQVRDNKWGGQTWNHNNVNKLIGKGISLGTHSTKYLKFSSMFLMILFASSAVETLGNSLKRGGSYGLKIPVKYCFCGQEKIL